MLLQQQFAGSDDVLRLGAVEADAFDELFQSGDAQFEQRLRCVGFLVKRTGRPVNAFVRGLGGQDHRHQQFKGGGVFQFTARFGVGGAKAFVNGAAAGGVHAVSGFMAGARAG